MSERFVRRAWCPAATGLVLLALFVGCGRDRDRDREPASPPAATSQGPTIDELGAESAPRTFDWRTQVGVAGADAHGALVMAVPDDSLRAGTRVTLIWTGEPQRTIVAQVVARRERPWLVAGQPVEGSAYDLAAETPAPRNGAIAIAVTGDVGEPATTAGRVHVDLDGDGQLESFSECTSAEGLHLSVWSGEPRTGPQTWHRYVPLGRDLEITCTEVETGSP